MKTFPDSNRNHMVQQVFYRLVQDKLTSLPSPTWEFWSPDLHQLCFLSSCMAQEPSSSHSSFHPLSPPPLCTMQGKAQCNVQEISQPCPFSVILQERHGGVGGIEARDASRALICSEQREVQQFLWSHHRLGEQISPSQRGTKEIIQREFI